ncbi:lipocalin family protein [uncultured Dokdonia sp.]|uniref:lipocalin family protein n=1 Tax=uncultured Dokdonia sp. TaxID=575653 RepID=UPI002603D9F4|nr:lipocalin family protein [uncultured Dokdonia sp.]
MAIMSILSSCTTDDEKMINPDYIGDVSMFIGTWKESNVLINGVQSQNQIICNGEREQYMFNDDNTFTERDFGDNCQERIEGGTFSETDTSFTLEFTNDSEVYELIELTDTTLRFSFNDGGSVIEQIYTKL